MADMLTRSEVAKMLGVSVRTLRRWASLGQGPKFSKFNQRGVRYYRKDVFAFRHDFMPEQQEIQPPETPEE